MSYLSLKQAFLTGGEVELESVQLRRTLAVFSKVARDATRDPQFSMCQYQL